MKKKELVSEYALTGPCVVDVGEIVNQWDHRFVLFQTDNPNADPEFRFVKFTRRGSGSTDIKVTISKDQAAELIEKMKLVQTRDILFVRASTWRPVGMSEYDMIPRRQ